MRYAHIHVFELLLDHPEVKIYNLDNRINISYFIEFGN